MEEKENNLTLRQNWLFDTLYANSLKGKRLSVEEIVDLQNSELEQGTLPYNNLYSFAENDIYKNCPAIYEDKDCINENDEKACVVCCKDRQFYIGSEKENILYHNKLANKIYTYSHKCKLVRNKISADGQMQLFDVKTLELADKDHEFKQAFIKNQSLVKELEKKDNEIQKLKDLIKLYKNENQMWKERYEQAKKGNLKC